MSRPKKITLKGRRASAKFRETMRRKYGDDYKSHFAKIGAKGGANGKGNNYKGGFSANPALAKIAGAKGGAKSRRGASYKKEWEEKKNEIISLYEKGDTSIAALSRQFGIPYSCLRSYFKKEDMDILNLELG